MKISLCMIVKNEEENLPIFISRHQALFDDWVIVDTGSTDETQGIIQAAGFPRHEFPWQDDFALARNHALSLCQGDWIIAMDADEFFSQDHQALLRQVLPKAPFDAIDVPIKNYVREEHGTTVEYQAPDGSFRKALKSEEDLGYLSTQLIRVFRRNKGFQWESPIHEVLNPPPQTKIAHLEGLCIHHLGMLHHHEEKRKDYARLASELLERAESSQNPKLLFEAARLLEDHPNKIRLLNTALDLAPADPAILKALIQEYTNCQDWDLALFHTQALAQAHPSLESHLALALVLNLSKGASDALTYLESLYGRHRQESLYQMALAQYAALSHDQNKAKGHAQRALKLAPESPQIQGLWKTLHPHQELPTHV